MELYHSAVKRLIPYSACYRHLNRLFPYDSLGKNGNGTVAVSFRLPEHIQAARVIDKAGAVVADCELTLTGISTARELGP